MANRTHVKIKDRLVPISPGEPTTAKFSGGRDGEKDEGDWEFWTSVSPIGGKVFVNTIRCPSGEDPGDRLSAMETRPGEAKDWPIVYRATHVEPATVRRVNKWLAHPDHTEDARHLQTAYVGGKAVRIIQTSDGQRLEEDGG